ncbi:hypothetical protein [Pedobacter agri]|uniref:hypothetical protein n=1 Tax=Pedobacter agri TaxID=454586 RepID=UPI00292E6CC3|nr:hypothetical protein [Pedobacter agri]
MEAQNQNNIKIWWFGRVRVEVFSAMTALVSTLIGIVALIMGVWQFNKSLDKTDEQIKFLKNETIERNEENRPLVRLRDFTCTNDGGTWHYKFDIKNEGKRQADSMIIYERVLAYDGNENLSKSDIIPIYSRNSQKQGGLFSNEDFFQSRVLDAMFKDMYLVQVDVKYVDVVSRLPYRHTGYYKVDLRFPEPVVTPYYEDQKHSDQQLHKEFHQVFEVYFTGK